MQDTICNAGAVSIAQKEPPCAISIRVMHRVDESIAAICPEGAVPVKYARLWHRYPYAVFGLHPVCALVDGDPLLPCTPGLACAFG